MSYSRHTFVQSATLTAAQMNQIEENIAAHVHGVSSVSLVTSGSLGAGAVNSSNIASGQIGFDHLAPEANLVKAWARVNMVGGVASLLNSRGITAVAMTGNIRLGFTLTSTMASSAYSITTQIGLRETEVGSWTRIMENPQSRSLIGFSIHGADTAGSQTMNGVRELAVIVAGDNA